MDPPGVVTLRSLVLADERLCQMFLFNGMLMQSPGTTADGAPKEKSSVMHYTVFLPNVLARNIVSWIREELARQRCETPEMLARQLTVINSPEITYRKTAGLDPRTTHSVFQMMREKMKHVVYLHFPSSCAVCQVFSESGPHFECSIRGAKWICFVGIGDSHLHSVNAKKLDLALISARMDLPKYARSIWYRDGVYIFCFDTLDQVRTMPIGALFNRMVVIRIDDDDPEFSLKRCKEMYAPASMFNLIPLCRYELTRVFFFMNCTKLELMSDMQSLMQALSRFQGDE